MRGILKIGKYQNKEGFFAIDLQKEHPGLILLTGMTGSGKGITHFHLYSQLMGSRSPDELGFVFLDMTRVDFGRWPKEYLYRPVVNSADEGLTVLEELGQESIMRDEGKADKRRLIAIHIEECDMVVKDRERFERALLNITGRAGSNNMFVVFSTSRPSTEVFTGKVLAAADLKIVHQLASETDWLNVISRDFSREISKPGAKAVSYGNSVEILKPFSDAYVRAIENWEAGGFVKNARPDYATYASGANEQPTTSWFRRLIGGSPKS